MAIATGNTLILKPSERDPGAGGIIAELCERAGIPKGVLNIIHGGVETVNFICDEPRIKAISFVGSDIAGKHIWDRGSKNGKRVQANLGAKSELFRYPLSFRGSGSLSQKTIVIFFLFPFTLYTCRSCHYYA